MKNTYFLKGLLAVLMCSFFLHSCKKFDNSPPVFEELNRQIPVARKVIVISIDGLSGSELKTANPETIMGLLPTAKYSFQSFKSAVATDAASWVSMMTGVPYNKHLVQDDTFQATPAQGAGEHDAVPVRRNVLDLMMSAKNVKTAFVTPWPALREYLKIADYRPQVSTDQEVADSTVSILGRYTQIGTVVANLREVEAAGANGGYLASNQVYKDAILKADAQVKQILDAVKTRKTFANEDWLIVITANHGGSSADPTNGFIIVSNPRFKSTEIKDGGFSTVQMGNTSIGADAVSDLYDLGVNGNCTVQMQVKFNLPSTAYTGFLSKGSGWFSLSPPATGGKETSGWSWGTWVGGWAVYYGSTPFVAGQRTFLRNYIPGTTTDIVIADGKWHTLTMTLNRVNASTRTMTCYTDGVQTATNNIQAAGSNLTSSQPLRIGFRDMDNKGTIGYLAANLAYFDTALDATTIKNNLDLKDIKQHPNYNSNLVGFWKMDEGAESSYQNFATKGVNMQLFGPYVWTKLGSDAPSQSSFSPVVDGYVFKPTSSDLSALMMYWMNVNINPDYDINGYPFIKDFEQEFVQ